MIESLFLTSFKSFVLGMLMGVVDAWNKKVTFGIWLLAVVSVLIGLCIEGQGYVDSLHWGVWNWTLMIVFVVFGMNVGKTVYTGMWRDNK